MRTFTRIFTPLALEITATILAAAAGIYALATFDAPDARVGLVLLTPAVEAALPLIARVVRPGLLHNARVVATLLVAFYIALAPDGIDRRLYVPALVVLVVVWMLSTRERFKEAVGKGREGR